MKLKILDQKNPDLDLEHLSQLDALYAGGRAFKEKIRTFLPPNEMEPPDVYLRRTRESHYRSYLSTVIDYYTSWLFSAGFELKARDKKSDQPVDTDKYYKDLGESADGAGTDLVHFMRERVRRALVDGRSYWLLEKPPNEGYEPADKAEFDERHLGDIELHPVDACAVWDWQYGEQGELLWCKLHLCNDVDPGPFGERNKVEEIWKFYTDKEVVVFRMEYEKGRRPTDPETEVAVMGEPVPHGFDHVPLCSLVLPEGMWIADKVASAQIEHFRLASALAWLIRRTCYAMPVFNLESSSSVPTHGAGYYIGIGLDEKFSWSSPPNAPFDVLGQEVDSAREEIFRITHQLALGMSNNADTVGRSADSKEFDVAATRVMLNAYGQIISACIERMLDKISVARGDENIKWSIEGFSGFDTATVSQLIASAKLAKDLGIPSKTFHREINTKVATAMLPDASDHIKADMRKEIAEAAEKMQMPVNVDPSAAINQTHVAKADALQAKAKLDNALADNPSAMQPSNN